MKIDPRLENIKKYPRAMQSYVMTLYEFVYEIRPKYMLEIGVGWGQSTLAILMAMKANNFGKLVSIDHKRRGDFLSKRENYSDLGEYWKLIRGDE